MDSNEKFWLSIWSIIAINAVVLFLGLFHFSNQRMKIFVDNGYTRQTLQGADCPQWVKIDKEN